MTIQVTYKGKDQNWQDGSTTYWFELNGECRATGQAFNGDVYGVCECCEGVNLLDSESMPLDGLFAHLTVEVYLEDAVTDEMRAE